MLILVKVLHVESSQQIVGVIKLQYDCRAVLECNIPLYVASFHCFYHSLHAFEERGVHRSVSIIYPNPKVKDTFLIDPLQGPNWNICVNKCLHLYLVLKRFP